MSELCEATKSTPPVTVFLKDYHPPLFQIESIDLTFDLQEAVTIVTSKMQIKKLISADAPLILDGENLTLESLKLNGKMLLHEEYELMPHCLVISKFPENGDLEIITKIYPHKNTALSGLYWTENTFCTQCEAEGFRRITYYLDHPDVLTVFKTTIIADQKRYPFLLSNGNLIQQEILPNGKHLACWEDPFKKPSYLFALVAGNFDLVEDAYITKSKKNIQLKIYVEKGYADQTTHALYALKEAMKWDEETYQREYDLDIYMIVAIGAFNMGAMENKGLNIFNTKYVLAKPQTATDEDYIHILSVIGHEYFHNWTGNRVTCRDWFQLSLKEGLTIFRDQSFSEDLISYAAMRIRDVTYLRDVQFTEDEGPLSHPVRPESYIEINNFYTATVYNKGAELWRMLETIVGKKNFREGMNLYFKKFDGQAVTLEDLVQTMEEVAKINLSQFRLWYMQAGTPLIHVEEDYDIHQNIYTLRFHQSVNSKNSEIKPFYIPIKMSLLNQSGQLLPLYEDEDSPSFQKTLFLTNTNQTFIFKNITERPIPSLFEDFSAPIKLTSFYSLEDLQILFKHNKNEFNRWDAGQKYAVDVMLALIASYQRQAPLSLPTHFIDSYKFILEEDVNDKLFLVEMLTLPSEKYLAQQMKEIDVEAIHFVREFVLHEIANQLQNLLLEKYYYYQKNLVDHFSLNSIGKRQLKNMCLSYLLLLPAYIELGVEQFNQSLNTNMTNTQVALIGLANIENEFREKLLHDFYATWRHDALVVDKWLSIQAGTKLPDALSQVKKLMRHESFDLKNPNKVYALIGSFGRNQINFHHKNGEGYAFLAETITKLDKLNPQIAARMVNPLTTWRRYDKERRVLMCEQLEKLLKNSAISPDLYELVTKSLND